MPRCTSTLEERISAAQNIQKTKMKIRSRRVPAKICVETLAESAGAPHTPSRVMAMWKTCDSKHRRSAKLKRCSRAGSGHK